MHFVKKYSMWKLSNAFYNVINGENFYHVTVHDAGKFPGGGGTGLVGLGS